MPKMKTNRTAYKKFRSTSKGKIKRARAYKSHNTAKKTGKQRRQLRGTTLVSEADVKLVRGLLPYL